MHSSHKPDTARLKEQVQIRIEHNDHTSALLECVWFIGRHAIFYAGILQEIRKEEKRLNYLTPDMVWARAILSKCTSDAGRSSLSQR